MLTNSSMHILGLAIDLSSIASGIFSISLLILLCSRQRRGGTVDTGPVIKGDVKKRYQRLTIILIATFIGSPIMAWPVISHWPRNRLVAYAVSEAVVCVLMFAILFWGYKKACKTGGDDY